MVVKKRAKPLGNKPIDYIEKALKSLPDTDNKFWHSSKHRRVEDLERAVKQLMRYSGKWLGDDTVHLCFLLWTIYTFSKIKRSDYNIFSSDVWSPKIIVLICGESMDPLDDDCPRLMWDFITQKKEDPGAAKPKEIYSVNYYLRLFEELDNDKDIGAALEVASGAGWTARWVDLEPAAVTSSYDYKEMDVLEEVWSDEEEAIEISPTMEAKTKQFLDRCHRDENDYFDTKAQDELISKKQLRELLSSPPLNDPFDD